MPYPEFAHTVGPSDLIGAGPVDLALLRQKKANSNFTAPRQFKPSLYKHWLLHGCSKSRNHPASTNLRKQ